MPSVIRIISRAEDPPWLAARTRRSAPADTQNGHWIIRAGSWLLRSGENAIPPTAMAPCVLLGATREAANKLQTAWLDALRRNGGIFRPEDADDLPPVLSLWMNESAADACADEDDLQAIVKHALAQNWPVYRHAALDVCHDTRLRVLQIITSLQRGGAERLALDLHHALPRHRIATTLFTLGSPGREPFDAPSDSIQLRLPPNPAIRAAEIDRVIRQTGSDIAHAHLVDGETLAQLQSDLPLAVTIHNQRQGWPEAIARLHAKPDTLLIGCSKVVAAELAAEFPHHTARTIWNGITPALQHAATPSPRPLTLVSIANPRPQKRLPLLIDILAALPGARLKIAGQPSAIHADAQAEVRACEAKIAAHGLTNAVEWLGTVQDVPALLAECDVLVATSLHEGMSLAQLEALAAGVPVVATHVSGTDELAARHPGMIKLLPVDAPADKFAAATLEIAPQRGQGTLAADFTTPVMAARHAWLMNALLIPARAPRNGLLLVTNNFSTGGAQSSARRLLLQLRDMGEHVRAVVLQEQPDHPTPGRRALQDAGIEVIALDPPEVCEAQHSLTPLLHRLAAAPPEALLFWNVIPEYKILLADALRGIRMFDVSPGEMFFASLDRYFANPRPGLPYLDAAAYGARLNGVIVKHEREVGIAEAALKQSVHSIPNGVPLRPFQSEKPGTEWTLGTAARLHPHKRLDDLIAAFRLLHETHPQVRLRIAGGPDAGQEDHAEALRQSSRHLPIEWCGEIHDIAAFHDTLSLFVMISEPIGCPNASLEAMASSLPVIATAVGGACEQIEHGITGLLTPPRDAASLAEAMRQLLDDPDRRVRMRHAAHTRVRRRFSLEIMAARYRTVCLGR
ncbi:MAG: glycosyltransferase [Verrucomicrobiaceae bacterium]|nr:glycosyltransferase [Verrucomicrobiaceae bacterium]